MAMIPKKRGHRCVATMASGYRMYTSLEEKIDKQWNIDNSHADDSCKPETSCLRAAEERLIEQEILVNTDYQTLVILWDFVKFYDTIQYDVLANECKFNNYGRKKTAMSMMVHAAPRMLKMGKAVGKPIQSMGRGIVAGCKRSQSLAKCYTNRFVEGLRFSFHASLPKPARRGTHKENAAAELRSRKHAGLRVFQHVDDLTQIMWAGDDQELAARAYTAAKDWAIVVRDKLHMECSDKNVIIPPGMPQKWCKQPC